MRRLGRWSARLRAGLVGAAPTLAAVALSIAWLSSPAAVEACNTPVYRYAMNYWAPTPYYVFYLYENEVDPADADIQARLKAIDVAGPDSANVATIEVDMADPEEKKRLDSLVKERWEKHGGKTPMHLLFSPWGVELFAGRLDTATLDALLESPKRKQLAELMHEGNATVLMLLPGSDQKANNRAREAVKKIVAQVNESADEVDAELEAARKEAEAAAEEQAAEKQGDSGEATEGPEGEAGDEAIDPYADPYGDPYAMPGQDPTAQALPMRIAWVELDPNNAKEKWLRQMLGAIEELPEDLADQPQVFALYGRGRALEPYVGEGITVENLQYCLEFLGGACSCMIKEQNPGQDLLFSWDWEATARSLPEVSVGAPMPGLDYEEWVPEDEAEQPAPEADASKTNDEEEMQSQGEQLAQADSGTPEAAAETRPVAPASKLSAETVAAATEATAEAQPAAPAPEATEDSAPQADAEQAAGPSAPAEGDGGQLALADQPEGTYLTRQVWLYGSGLAVVVAVLGVASFLVMRKNG
jgi:hypothetical protein